ncbi:MAG: ABC transporter transmembrane domain-containing protein, partial [Muribaculaceae bacterium]|nr:ABC transporter transmembrane domain-containing protein [Muribaculaceae bacterium]
MIEMLKHKFALSEQGAKDMLKAFIACVLSNLALFFPAILLYNFVSDLLGGGVSEDRISFYIGGITAALVLIFVTTYFQYNATFFATYVESGVRRLTLAEKLRKIPLSFFGKKDLSDLTSTIMSDGAMLEQGLSHWVPEFIGSVISTVIMAVGIFFFNRR